MPQQTLKYPIGVQSFQEIRKDGSVYVDKTQYIWNLVNSGKYYFLSRPRRFGKSLLLSTLEAYFKGQKELFKGLAISGLEKDWTEYPVLHLALNAQIYDSVEALEYSLTRQLKDFANAVGVQLLPDGSVADKFIQLIIDTYKSKDQRVVVLVDEYDKPLLSAVDDKELYTEYQRILKGFYGVIKSYDSYIKFAMLTGVARFSKVSVFSDLNNLNDISLDEQYNSLCGISKTELDKYFTPSIETLANRFGQTLEWTKDELKRNYDGYHFSDPKAVEDIYNPFSLLNCFWRNDFGESWFESGTPSFLIKMLVKEGADFSNLNFKVKENILKGINVPENSVKALMYQTGYLTIKDYNPKFRIYTIGLPNEEVRSGLYNLSFIVYGSKRETEFDVACFLSDLEEGRVDAFMERLKALISSIPYEQARQSEATYHNVLFLLFTVLGYRTESEHHMSRGRSDLMVQTDHYIYLFEFKYDGTAEEALRQIDERQYDAPYKADGREIVKIGVNFSSNDRNIDHWLVK